MFSRDESISSGGAYWADRVDVAPVFLAGEFGAPAAGDGIRVSGQYTFRSETGIVFTVHDYKATTLWATDEDLPTPEAFWQLHAAQEFSIGSRGVDAKAFREWLLKRDGIRLNHHRALGL
jgi:hypothetical protein